MGFDELADPYHIPKICDECGGVLVFVGVGEYHCEKCGTVRYDDYGKVRLYIEKHPGANASEVENATGVTQRSIRRMLKENRIEIAENSKVTLFCESCGKAIRSGRFCPECETKYHKNLEETQRRKINPDMQGFGLNHGGEEGQRRFMRK